MIPWRSASMDRLLLTIIVKDHLEIKLSSTSKKVNGAVVKNHLIKQFKIAWIEARHLREAPSMIVIHGHLNKGYFQTTIKIISSKIGACIT